MLSRRPEVALLLNHNLREKRNFGGKDSSGKWHGDALEKGVRQVGRGCRVGPLGRVIVGETRASRRWPTARGSCETMRPEADAGAVITWQAMAELYNDAPSIGRQLSVPQLNLSQVQQPWWLSSDESKELVAERVTELFSQVRHRAAVPGVRVGVVGRLRRVVGSRCSTRF